VIDDGSSDSSASIVYQLQKKYNNIYLYHKKNGGLSSARNYGLSKARGEYIWFVDSDDWIENNCLLKLHNIMQSNDLDCIWFNHQQVFEKNGTIKRIQNSLKNSEVIYNGKDFLAKIFGASCYACMFWFRRKWLEENSFLFKEGILYEDLEAIPSLLLKANRIKHENLIIYNYYIRESSIINKYNSKKISSLITAIDRNVELYKNSQYKKSLKRIVSHNIIGLLRLVSSDAYKRDKQIVINYLNSINLKLEYKKELLLDIFLYNISPKLLIKVYSIIRKLI